MMKNLLKTIFSILIVSCMVTPSLVNASPSYKIGLIPEDYSTNKGEPLKITIAISGNGNLSFAKLLAYGDKSVTYPSGIVHISQENDSDYFITHIDLESVKEDQEMQDKFKEYGVIDGIIPIIGEKGFKEIAIKSEKPGDHKIIFILTYSQDGENWYSDKQEFTFHVNSWWDNYQGGVAVAGIIIAFFIGFLAVDWDKWPYLKKKGQKIKKFLV